MGYFCGRPTLPPGTSFIPEAGLLSSSRFWTPNTSGYDSCVPLFHLSTMVRTNSSGYISSHSVSISSGFDNSLRDPQTRGSWYYLFVGHQLVDNGPIAARLICIPETSPKAGLGCALLTSKGLPLRNWDDVLPSSVISLSRAIRGGRNNRT